MLKVNSRSSMNGGSGSTIIASIIPRPVRGCAGRPVANPWPHLTGAAMRFSSYLRATAKRSGLTTTTFALGTACIIRRRAISRCMLRMRALICGSPSDFLAFLADFFLGHAQLAVIFPQLVGHIDQGDETEGRRPPRKK
jgi:hypothetical protein